MWLIILLEGYRNRFTSVEKKKARWIFFSGIICGGLGFVFFLLPASIFSQSIIPGHLLGLILIPFPVCLAISVFRHQLFDIDIIIRRTLLYTSLTICLGIAYLLGILVLQSLFQSITGQSNQLAIVISTVGIFLAIRCVSGSKGIDRASFASGTIPSRLAAFFQRTMKSISLNCQPAYNDRVRFIAADVPVYLAEGHVKTGLDKAWHMLLDQDDETGE
jgi:hypothetical protein